MNTASLHCTTRPTMCFSFAVSLSHCALHNTFSNTQKTIYKAQLETFEPQYCISLKRLEEVLRLLTITLLFTPIDIQIVPDYSNGKLSVLNYTVLPGAKYCRTDHSVHNGCEETESHLKALFNIDSSVCSNTIWRTFPSLNIHANISRRNR